MRATLLMFAVLFLGVGVGQAQDAGASPDSPSASAAGPLRGWLGLRLQDLTPDLAPKFNLPADSQGALVADVAPQGPGQAAGFLPGDVVQTFDGKVVVSVAALKALVRQSSGQEIRLHIWRNGKSLDLTAKVGSKGGPGAGKAESKPAAASLGLELRPMTAAEAVQNHLDAGLVVERVSPGSPAEKGGLHPGDIMLELEHSAVGDPVAWARLEQDLKPGDTALLRFRRADSTLYQTLGLPAPPVPALDAQGRAFTPIDVEYGTFWDADTGPYTAVSGYTHEGQRLTRFSQFKDVIEPLNDPQATSLLERSAAMQTGGVLMVVGGAAACVGGLANLLNQVSTEASESRAGTDGPNLVQFFAWFGGGTLLWVGGAVVAIVGADNERPKAVERYNQVIEGMKNLSLMQMPDSRQPGLVYRQSF